MDNCAYYTRIVINFLNSIKDIPEHDRCPAITNNQIDRLVDETYNIGVEAYHQGYEDGYEDMKWESWNI